MAEKPTYGELQRRVSELENTAKWQKRTEDSLIQSRQIISGILNSVPVRVFWKDRNLVYLGCNEVFARDAGFTDPNEVVGKNDFQMGWKAQADLYREDDRRVIESGVPKLLIEEPQTTPDGDTITLLTSKVPLRDASGEIDGVLGTYFDITERKRTEAALAKERERADSALEHIKTLRGIVPICATCKKIRDDKGYWNQVELYISEHSEAEFSHGICPECVAKHHLEFPDHE